jgi:hypothetical protein
MLPHLGIPSHGLEHHACHRLVATRVGSEGRLPPLGAALPIA